MKVTTNVKGQIAASKTELRALELGYIPSKPIFDARYDLILDDSKGKLTKIQIKYGDGKMSNSQGAVMVKLGYEDRRKKLYTYQANEIDGLVVYLPKIDRLCYFPPEVFCGKVKIHVRYQKTRNNQSKGILYAEDYFW
ncbi:MAG: group I intron-associated PD-(D/E)XK endonuclease [bacterium]|nr:group I intron-associated PD-(D/E)XK endonuclease [bacterium]